MMTEIRNPCLAGKQAKSEIRNRGFTLIETLLAVTILAMAMAGPIGLAVRGVRFIGTATDQITAFYIAAEGIEYVRNVRDENFLNQRYWLSGLDNCRVESNPNGCYIEVPKPGNNITACAGMCPVMQYNDNKGYYAYGYGGPGIDTKFTRTIKLTDVASGEEVRAESTVSWKTRIGTRSMTLQENIFDWRP